MMTYSIFATKGDIHAAVFVSGSATLQRTILTKQHNLKIFNKTFDFPNNTLAGFDSAIVAMRHLLVIDTSYLALFACLIRASKMVENLIVARFTVPDCTVESV